MTDHASYNDNIESNAEQFGYKAANLIELDPLCNAIPPFKDIKLGVPPFRAISHKTIQAVLGTEVTQAIKSWWQEFGSEIQGKQVLDSKAKGLLEKIRDCIYQKIMSYEPEVLMKQLGIDPSQYEALMVRSTGRAEDSAKNSNPGGNDSFPSKNEAANIQTAIALVVMSYFGDKSIIQRLQALQVGENIAAQSPFTSCLLQALVGELTPSQFPVSGVIYATQSDDGSTRSVIHAAPGHGETVVNGLSPADCFTVDSIPGLPDPLVLAEIVDKPRRKVPVLAVSKDEPPADATTSERAQFEKQKLSLAWKDNTFEKKTRPALPREVVEAMHYYAQEIRKQYGRDMDIEFVYDPRMKKINIVQARAITQNPGIATEPLAIDPDKISEVKQLGKCRRVLTLGTQRAQIINRPDEVIIAETINEALKLIQNKPKGSIKAVMVRQYAPSTSHEAGEFKKLGIPVLQMGGGLSEARAWVRGVSSKNPLIIDPQRKMIATPKEGIAAEAVLAKGLFRSNISQEISLFGQSPDLAAEAKAWHQALTRPLSFASKLDALRMATLLDAIKDFGGQPGKKEKIQQILAAFIKYAENHRDKVGDELITQIKIFGMLIDQMVDPVKGVKPESLPRFLDYLEKFEGAFLASPEPGLHVDSVVARLAQHQDQEAARKLVAPENNSEYAESLLYLNQYALTEEIGERWTNFCNEIGKNEKDAQILAGIVGNIAKFGCAGQWLNVVFDKYAKKNGDNAKALLLALAKDYHQNEEIINHLSSIEADLDRLKGRIDDWAEPGNFDTLLRDLRETRERIQAKLAMDPSKSELALSKILVANSLSKLADIIDLTCKAIQNSGSYSTEQKELQAQRFAQTVMELVELLDFIFKNKGAKDAEEGKLAEIEEIIKMLKERLFKKFNEAHQEDLNINPMWNVSVFENLEKLGSFLGSSLNLFVADLHTIIHQLAIAHTSLDIEMMEPTPFTAIFSEAKEKYPVEDAGNAINVTTNMVFRNKKFIASANIPLREHSASYSLTCDLQTKKQTLTFKMEGKGSNENGRWGYLATDLLFVSKYLGAKAKDCSPLEDDQSFSSYEMSFEVSTPEQVDKLVQAFHSGLNYSFLIGIEYSVPYDFSLYNRMKTILGSLDDDNFHRYFETARDISPTLQVVLSEPVSIEKQSTGVKTKLAPADEETKWMQTILGSAEELNFTPDEIKSLLASEVAMQNYNQLMNQMGEEETVDKKKLFTFILNMGRVLALNDDEASFIIDQLKKDIAPEMLTPSILRARPFLEKGYTMEQFQELPQEKLETLDKLMSTLAGCCHAIKAKITIQDLLSGDDLETDFNKLVILLPKNAASSYEGYSITPKDLSTLPIEKAKCILSQNFFSIFKFNCGNVSKAKDLPLEVLRQLSGKKLKTLVLNSEFMLRRFLCRFLCSEKAIELYKNFQITPLDLASLQPALLEKILSASPEIAWHLAALFKACKDDPGTFELEKLLTTYQSLDPKILKVPPEKLLNLYKIFNNPEDFEAAAHAIITPKIDPSTSVHLPSFTRPAPEAGNKNIARKEKNKKTLIEHLLSVFPRSRP